MRALIARVAKEKPSSEDVEHVIFVADLDALWLVPVQQCVLLKSRRSEKGVGLLEALVVALPRADRSGVDASFIRSASSVGLACS